MINISKTSILIPFLLLTVHFASAQVYLGGQGGFNRSQTTLFLSGDAENIFIQQRSVNKATIGVALDWELTDMMGVLIEPIYLIEGTLLENRMTAGGSSFFNENIIKYLRLPVLFKLRFNLGACEIYGVGGLSLAYALGGSTYTWTPFESTDFQRIDFESEAINRLDYGTNLGLGLEREIAKGVKINAGLRYYWGFNDITDGMEQEVYNESFALQMGMFFPIGQIEQ